MTHTNHTPKAVPPAQGVDEPGTEDDAALLDQSITLRTMTSDLPLTLTGRQWLRWLATPAVPQGAAAEPPDVERMLSELSEMRAAEKIDPVTYYFFRATLAALRQSLASAEKDKMRMNWLEKHPLASPILHHTRGWETKRASNLRSVGPLPTLREAIDAALPPAKPTQTHIVDFRRAGLDWRFECECGARWSMGVSEASDDGDRIQASINNHLHSAGLKPSEVL